jgi:glutamate-5-semialdehyde dehydrogenase
MVIPYGGDQATEVSAELAAVFVPGDRLVVVQTDGTLLHIPQAEHRRANLAVTNAADAFVELGNCTDSSITAFYDAFARRLGDDTSFAPIAAANTADVEHARAVGRSTTRLELTAKMRAAMVEGLRGWRDSQVTRTFPVEEIQHDGWTVEQVRSPLGVVAFVFEGRPNVFADATGVLRSGNTVVFRIGSDALGTARAIVQHALEPALAESGLPLGCVQLLDSPARSAGWALFSHPKVTLAVARGSGAAVEQLGAVARQSGIAVSLHGAGGAWMITGDPIDPERFRSAVLHSLDRKVCNTLNVCCILRDHATAIVLIFLDALQQAAAARGVPAKLHVALGSEGYVDADWFTRRVGVVRAGGSVDEPQAELLPVSELGREWEWEESPEVSLVVVDSVEAAVALCNLYGPRLVASFICDDTNAQERFWNSVDVPFVGDGFTRWVDGQFALDRPELGLSNWQNGRLFARSAVLSGDSVHTVRTRVRQTDPGVHR